MPKENKDCLPEDKREPDGQEFVAFLSENYNSLLSYCKYLLNNNKYDAEDVMHDMIDELNNKWAGMDLERVYSWCLLTIQYKSKELFRERKRFGVIVPLSDAVNDESLRVEAALDANVSDEMIEAWKELILSKLGKKDRELYELVHEKRLTQQEIAIRQKAKLATVKKRIMRMRRKLHAVIVELRGSGQIPF